MRTSSIVLLLWVGCASKPWKAAKKTHTAAAYRAFATQNPGDKHRKVALQRADDLDWAHATAEDTPKAWEGFIIGNPRSPRLESAQEHLEEARWHQARQIATEQAYERYLNHHRVGPHADEARAEIDGLAYKRAEAEATADSYGRYLARFPRGAHADEAYAKREAIVWGRTQAADTPAAYQDYLHTYPNGAHADEADAALDGFRFSGIALQVVLESSLREDSHTRWKKSLEVELVPWLKGVGLPVKWLPLVDARRTQVDPFDGLLGRVPEDHAALVLVIHEKPGRRFTQGRATDVEATVHLVPPARLHPMQTVQVTSSTASQLTLDELVEMHWNAQERLGRAIRESELDVERWKR